MAKARFLTLTAVSLGMAVTAAAADQAKAPPPRPVSAAVAPLPDAPPTQVAPLIVDGRTVVPQVGTGAPLYTVEELKTAETMARRAASTARFNSDLCSGGGGLRPFYDAGATPTLAGFYAEELNASQKLVATSQKAQQATGDAAAARTRAMSGEPQAIQAALDAELVRQSAVNAFVAARDAFAESRSETRDLMGLMKEHEQDDPVDRRNAAQGYRLIINTNRMTREAINAPEGIAIDPNFADLAITHVVADPKTDGKGGYVRVSGLVANPRDKEVIMPPLSLTALDPTGFKLSTIIADPMGKPKIPPHKAIQFSYDFRPKPAKTSAIFLTFADNGYRAMQVPASYFCRTG